MKFNKPILVVLVSLLSLNIANTAHAEEGFTTHRAKIQSIDILILESFPVQVHVRITGTLSDSCTTLEQITQKREDTTFILEVTTKRPVDVMCAQVMATFYESVSLDVAGLKAGTYTVEVNNMKDTFVLQIDNR